MGGRVGPPAGRERIDQGAALVLVQVAREREPRDAAPAERADERLEVERPAAKGPAVDHDLVIQPEEGEGILAALVARRHHTVAELRERAGHRRVRGRVERAGGERPGHLGDQPLDGRLPGRRARLHRAGPGEAAGGPGHPALRRRSHTARISWSRERSPRITSHARASDG